MRSTASCKAAALIVLFCAASFAATPTRLRIDLNGVWQFRLDPTGVGEREHWYTSDRTFPDSIQVPGCWQAQGFGAPSGILRRQYSGVAWYRKSIAIPASWREKRVTLRIGGALRIAELFVNGKAAGRHDGMTAPFEFDISDAIHPGAENSISLRVSNPGSTPGESPDKQIPSQPTGSLNYIGN
jgi:beta-galactosidase/beta-glucuronidase